MYTGGLHAVRYPPIAEHGLIGNLQTAALVDTRGTVAWYCPGRFDAPSVFASLIDHDQGGSFQIAPIGTGWTTRQLYLPDSAVLVTRFLGADRVAEVEDFMRVTGRATDTPHVLIRQLRVVRGQVRLAIHCAPRFDYARAPHKLVCEGTTALFHGPNRTLRLDSDLELGSEGDDVNVDLDLSAGATAWFALAGGVEDEGIPRRVGALEVDGRYRSTLDFWHNWVAAGSYRGRWRETVTRSAITLKLLTYNPSGAIVAAPTAGLPEKIGGERNWDYRYTWIRDAALSVHALLRLGYGEEARRLFTWLTARPGGANGPDGGPLQLMYRVDGSPDVDEVTLDHLEGYRQSSPVRIGNAAALQLQLDIYGELMDVLFVYSRYRGLTYESWQHTCQQLDWLSKHWQEADEGIWEVRGGVRHFLHSRLMCWVAFDRAARIARERGLPAPLDEWQKISTRIYREIMDKGWNEKKRSFVQYYGGEAIDASALLLALTGFIEARDPRMTATIDRIQRELTHMPHVYRYDIDKGANDGLEGHEGTFNICSFWLVEALARAGRLEQARLSLEHMLTYANHVGLYAEEIASTGEALGNFPQAFTHLALIRACLRVDEAINKMTPHLYMSL